MSKKDYQAFADMFAGEVALAGEHMSTVRAIILSTADIFAQDNPRFNRERFYVACGLSADGHSVGPRLPI